MKKLRYFMALSMAATLTLALAACGTPNTPQATPSPSSEATATPDGVAAQASTQPAAGDGPFDPLPEKAVLTVFKTTYEGGPDEYGETTVQNKYIDFLSEKLNIEYQFPNVMKGGSAADDKVRLMVTSNDFPDVLSVKYDLFRYMAKNDMIEDLGPAYEKYASPLVKEIYATDEGTAQSMATFDGKLLGMPTMGTVHNSDPLVWIRQDWLDKLGLTAPTTLDELCTVAQAFIEKDPDGNGQNDTVGLAFQEKFNEMQTYGLDGILQNFGVYARTWFKAEDGTYAYGSVVPEAKAALAKINDMYQKGLVNKDFAVTKSESAKEMVVSGKCGAFFGPWWCGWDPLTDSIKTDPAANWVAVALKNQSGGYAALQETPIGDTVVLKKGYAHPEAVIKSINYYAQLQLGDPEVCGGDPYEGRIPMPSWTGFPVQIGLWRADAVYFDNACMVAASKGEPFPEEVNASTADFYRTIGEQWNKGIDWLKQNPDSYGEPVSRFLGVAPLKEHDVQPVYGDFYGSTDTMAKRIATLDKMENQAYLDIIVGNKPVDSFDEFVSQWKAAGGDKIAEEIAQN